MSNTQEATEWMTNMDAQLRGRALLSTHEAWTLAMTWEKALRTKVVLKMCEVSERTSILKTYAWVHFEIRSPSVRLAEIVRATTLVWFALSSVPGFQVHENPIFWKYVLGDLREDKTATRFRASGGWSPPAEHYNPVRDASRFVDDEFPRVSLAFDAAMCRVVTGLTPCTDEDTRSKLHSMLTKLAPLVDPVQAQHTIALKLDGYYLKSVQAIEELTNDINKLDRLQDAATSIWRPRFSIAELCSFNEVNPAMRLPVGCEVFRYYAKDADPPAKVADEVLSILHAHDKPFARIEILHVVRWALTASQFVVICSALPHARVLHTLDLHEPVHPMIERVHLSDEEMVWLGYALFHPDTVTSSWKRLNVGDAISKCKSAPLILQRMARGNHLISVLSGSFDQVCSAYYSAQFSDNTVAYPA